MPSRPAHLKNQCSEDLQAPVLYCQGLMTTTAEDGLNLLKAEKTNDGGIKTKRLCCGWDHDYLLKVLTG